MAMRTASPWWASLVFGVGLLFILCGERLFGHLPGVRLVMTLLGATGLAVGIFASALTRSQIIALLVGAALMVILGNVYQLAVRVDSPVRDVLEQVDIWWVRFQNSFMRGILNLKDVVFYLATIYFFLLLAVKTLESKRWQ